MGKAYLGSKATAGLCQPLIGMMPPHNVYLETHLGVVRFSSASLRRCITSALIWMRLPLRISPATIRLN